MTVPQLAAAGKLEQQADMWHLMAMRRYGEVVEGARAAAATSSTP